MRTNQNFYQSIVHGSKTKPAKVLPTNFKLFYFVKFIICKYFTLANHFKFKNLYYKQHSNTNGINGRKVEIETLINVR